MNNETKKSILSLLMQDQPPEYWWEILDAAFQDILLGFENATNAAKELHNDQLVADLSKTHKDLTDKYLYFFPKIQEIDLGINPKKDD